MQTLYKIISQNKMFLLPTYPIFFQHVIGNRLFFLFGLKPVLCNCLSDGIFCYCAFVKVE